MIWSRVSTGSRGLLAVLLLLATQGCATRIPPETAWSGRFPDADTVRVTEVVPGVRHAYLWRPEGPWAVHVLEVDSGVCTPVVEAADPGPTLAARATTSVLADGALAGVNADFFMLPAGTPVGAHVRAGEVLAGPGDRPVFGVTPAGEAWAGTASLDGYVAAAGDTAFIVQVNRDPASARHVPPSPGLYLLDYRFGDSLPDLETPTLLVRQIGSGRGVVAGSDPGADSRAPAADRRTTDHPTMDRRTQDRLTVALTVGPAGAELTPDAAASAGSAEAWLRRRTPGDTVTWEVALRPAVAEAVGGFPLLLADGEGVYARQPGVNPGFGDARHPRTAVGWDEGGRMFWVVVDGRQAPYSDGMSLPEMEWLFLRLGATDALNLDGGGSTAMVLRGAVTNRPSDPSGEREVGNALILRGCR